jgi:orotidine-5'-phosphate decarboxylase
MQREQLIQTIFQKKSFLCVGLDPELSKLPPHVGRAPEAVLTFNKAIIDATRDLCVAYKPNLAFYEALGPTGWQIFAETVQYIGNEHFIIADAKRGDIGNTSRLYAEAFFERLTCDAVTIAPYMGEDSVAPFLGFEGKWAVVLALTSNKGSSDFQQSMLSEEKKSLWEQVLHRTAQWGTKENMMFVVGATHPQLFEQVRQIVPDHFLLVPGVGAQGGDLHAVCRYGLTNSCGLLINASRSIIYAGSGPDFGEAARAEAKKMQMEMAGLLM